MKFLKILLVIVVILVVGFFVYAGMSPNSMSVEHSEVINAAPEAVFEEVADYNNWSSWSPWGKKDPDMKVTIEGSGLNSSMIWTSEHREVGNGSQKIIELEENKFVRSELMLNSDQPSYAYFKVEPVGSDSTRLIWGFEEQELGLIEAGFMNLFGVQDMLDRDYVEGLDNLRSIAEAKPKKPKFEMKVEHKEAVNYVSKTIECEVEDLKGGKIHEQAYGEIGAYFGANGIQMTGAPLCLISRFEDDGMTIHLAFPVAELPTNIPEGLEGGTIEAGNVAYGIHYGSYEDVAPDWEAAENFVNENGLEVRSYPYEQYLNDPTTVSKESEIETAIAFPVK